MSNYKKNQTKPSLLMLSVGFLMSISNVQSAEIEIDYVGHQYSEMAEKSPYKVEVLRGGDVVESRYCHQWPVAWKQKAYWSELVSKNCINANFSFVRAGEMTSDGTVTPVRSASENKVWATDENYSIQFHSNILGKTEIDVLWPQFPSLTPNETIKIALKLDQHPLETLHCQLKEEDWSSRGSWSQKLALCINANSQYLSAGHVEPLSGAIEPNTDRNRVFSSQPESVVEISTIISKGAVVLTFPKAPDSSLEGELVTGHLINSETGELWPVSGVWGSQQTLDNLPVAQYQLVMQPSQDYVPYNTPVVLEVENASNTSFEMTYRPPIDVDKLSALPGVKIELFHQGLYQPRQMALGHNVLYVGSSAIPIDGDAPSGHIYAIELDEQGNAGQAYVVATGLSEPHGVAYRDGALYFSTVGALYRIDNIDNRYKNLPQAEAIFTYPADDQFPITGQFRYWHQKHPLKFNSVNKEDRGLYTAVGLPCNVCVMPDERYGSIFRIDLDTLKTEIIAKGIRNTVGFDFHPKTGEVWFSDNNRQGMINPDEINRVSYKGEHFGAPYVFGRDTIGIQQGEEDGTIAASMPEFAVLSDIKRANIDPNNFSPAAFEVESNSAPLGVMFWDGYPSSENQHHLLFATHGNGRQDIRPALELRMLTIEDGNRVAHERSLIQGWMQDFESLTSYSCLDEACIGRPVEMMSLADGSLLLSDDKANVIYRVHYQGDSLPKTQLQLSAPPIPDTGLIGKLLSGKLITPSGEERRFYMDWFSEPLDFSGLESGEYRIIPDPIDGWYPQPSSQTVVLTEGRNERISWNYTNEAQLGVLTLQAPPKPIGVEANSTEVRIMSGKTTHTLHLGWNEHKEVKLPFGSYTVYFGYQYGGLPKPINQMVNLDSGNAFIELSWQMRSSSQVGEVVLGETCGSCHGNNAENLNQQDVAARWIDLGYDALVTKVGAMTFKCDDICAEQVARTLWTERWSDYDPPTLPDDSQPLPGIAPQAILDPLVQFDNQTVTLNFSYVTQQHDLTWAPAVGAKQMFWSGINSLESLDEQIRNDVTADNVWARETMQTPQRIADHFGSVLRGFYVPKQSGDYRFYIAGDDAYELYFGSSKESMTRIAGDTRWTTLNDWTRYAKQKSEIQSLVEGQLYFIEARYVESSGGDHVSVGIQYQDGVIDVVAGEELGSLHYQAADVTAALKSQRVEYRYLQPEPSAWQSLAISDVTQRQVNVTLEFGGEIEFRIASYDANSGVTYSDSQVYTLDTLPVSSVSNQSLELYWNFDAPNVFRVPDLSGNERHLPIVTQTYTQDGVLNGALSPNQTKQEYVLGEDKRMDLMTEGMTVSFWTFATMEWNVNRLFMTQHNWFSQVRNGTLFIGPDVDSQRFSVSNFPLEQWVHVVYTRDSLGNAKLYNDGQLVASGVHSLDVDISNFAMARFLDSGKLDETRVYSRVLNAAEVLTLYQDPANAGGDDIVVETPDTPLPPISDMDGEQLYARLNCAQCHGVDGSGPVSIVDALHREDILDVIAQTMPYGNVGICDQECAEKLYAWMYPNFTGNAGGSTPPIGGGDSGLNGRINDWEAISYWYKITENLVGRKPTTEEEQLLEQYGANALEELLDDLLEEEAFLTRVEEIYNDLLHLKKAPNIRSYGRNVASMNGGSFDWYEAYANGNTSLRNYLRTQTEQALNNEGLALISHVVKHNLPFSEILTADYTLVNAYSAHYYGVQGQFSFRVLDNPEFQEAPWDPMDYQTVNLNYPHAGLISTPSYLITYPTTATNINRARSATFYKSFLDTDIMALGGSRPSSDDLEAKNATLENPACTGCHVVMDPVASAFKHWIGETNITYKALLSEDDWPLSSILPVGFNGEEAGYYEKQPLPWLTAKAVRDPRFARAMVKHLFVPITGHDLLEYPADDASSELIGAYQRQQQDIGKLAEAFIYGGYQFKALVKDLLLSEYAPRFNRFGGTRRLLTPELLDRKVSSLFAREWRYRGGTNWLSRDSDKLNLMYGGTDDANVKERDYLLNGVSASIQNFFANDFACQVVPFEFSQLPENRQIFKEVEPEGYTTRFELENAELDGATVETQYGHHMGSGYVQMYDMDQSVNVELNLKHSDYYQLDLSYAFRYAGQRLLELWIDDKLVQTMEFYEPTGGNDFWRIMSTETPFYLEAGTHSIQLRKVETNKGLQLDNISLRPLNKEEQQIRQLIADLHWKFYGEKVDVDDEQIDRAYQLFRFAQTVGKEDVYNKVISRRMEVDCRPSQHLQSDESLDIEDYTELDYHHYTRSWIALITYMLKDQRFFYE